MEVPLSYIQEVTRCFSFFPPFLSTYVPSLVVLCSYLLLHCYYLISLSLSLFSLPQQLKKKKKILSFLALWLYSPFLCSCPRAVLGSAAS